MAFLILFFTLSFYGCEYEIPQKSKSVNSESISKKTTQEVGISKVDTLARNLKNRFPPPLGFKRVNISTNSFKSYLRNIPLKAEGTMVQYYNGRQKANDGIYAAVVDLEIGTKDLHQCADAIMRLKAEYQWKNQQYDSIHFNLTNGFQVDYKEWMKGRRVVVDGNTTYWNNRNNPSNSYNDFWKYMEFIFSYAGTASLEKEMSNVKIEDMQIGDVFIQGGFPGHAVIVVDMAYNIDSGEQVYLLAQSYMPAQEIQILVNPSNPELSPWYKLNNESMIRTPEWTFGSEDLKRF